MRHALIGLALLLFAGVSLAQQRPEALQKLEAYWAALRTGHVEWSIVDHDIALDEYAGETRFQTSKCAGSDRMVIQRGNEDGVAVKQEGGAPVLGVGKEPVYTLETGAQSWYRYENPLWPATIYPLKATGTGDIWGYVPGWHDRSRTGSSAAAWKFDEGRDGGLDVVTVQKGDGITTTYWLDPQRAGLPIRVRHEHDERGWWFESRNTFKQFDGVWFPEVVERFSSRYKDGREPDKIIRVYSATFNRPEHHQRLTPADIGMEPGMEVEVRGPDMKLEMSGKWDGEKVVSFKEFAERLHKGEVTESPSLIRACLKAQAKAAQERRAAGEAEGDVAAVWRGSMTVEQARNALLLTPKQYESLWETYTKAFIKMYQLDEEQTQKALSILKGCQDRGNAHLNRYKAELERLDERVKAFTELKGEKRAAAGAEIRRERVRLLKPLNDIFERELKPRLERIPTRAQRTAAEKRDNALPSEPIPARQTPREP
jgi:hypothetical protein